MQKNKSSSYPDPEKTEIGDFLPDGLQNNNQKKGESPCFKGLEERTADIFEELRANLDGRYREGSIKVLLFTSISPGEGTTTVAKNFAATLAQNQKVLLIIVKPDRDSRNEATNSGSPLDSRSQINILKDPGVIKLSPSNYYVITLNGNHSSMLRFISSQEFKETIKTLREKFDFIILDAPPVNVFAKTRILCSRAEGVILVVEAGKTSLPAIKRIKKQLDETGAHILGVVLNKKKYYIPEFIYKLL